MSEQLELEMHKDSELEKAGLGLIRHAGINGPHILQT